MPLGRIVRPDGYILVRRPDHPLARGDGYVLEHRMVAWDAGLITDSAEHVHHIDGDKANNALANLEAVSAEDHAREHDFLGRIGRDKTECPQGHPYDGDNLYMNPRTHKRYCRECMRVANRRAR